MMIGVPFKARSCFGRSAFIRRPKPAAAMIAPTFIRKISAKLPFAPAVPVRVQDADRGGCSVPDGLRVADDATFRRVFPRTGQRSFFPAMQHRDSSFEGGRYFPHYPIVGLVQPTLTTLVGHRHPISTDQHDHRISRLRRLLEDFFEIGTAFDAVDIPEYPARRQSNCSACPIAARRIQPRRHGGT